MDNKEFEKLCDDSFKQFSLEIKKKVKNSPKDIDVEKDNVLKNENLLQIYF